MCHQTQLDTSLPAVSQLGEVSQQLAGAISIGEQLQQEKAELEANKTALLAERETAAAELRTAQTTIVDLQVGSPSVKI